MCFPFVCRGKLWSGFFGLGYRHRKTTDTKKVPATFFTGVQDNVVADSIGCQLHVKFFKNFERNLPCHSLLTNRHDCIVVIPESQGASRRP